MKFGGTRKSRYFVGGRLIDPPSSITDVSMLISDSLRIYFLINDLDDIEFLGGIQNVYLNANNNEKLFFHEK